MPSTCVVISDLLSVSCATVARKNLISWCKQRDFFSRRVGAGFTSISKQFYQHSGTIYRRSKSYLIVRISSDTVAENYGQVWLQFVMTTCVCYSDRWLCCGMHVDRKRPHLTARPEQCCWNRIDILNSGRLMQWYTVKSNNKPSYVMLICHCQIIDIYSYMNSGWWNI